MCSTSSSSCAVRTAQWLKPGYDITWLLETAKKLKKMRFLIAAARQ
jgi:hypothetical protein